MILKNVIVRKEEQQFPFFKVRVNNESFCLRYIPNLRTRHITIRNLE